MLDNTKINRINDTLCSWISKEGVFLDPILKNEIKDEYQYGNYILFSTLLRNRGLQNNLHINKIMKYLRTYDFQKPVYNEFNLESLVIAYKISKSNKLLETIKTLKNTSDNNFVKYHAFDFTLSKNFNENFRSSISPIRKDYKISKNKVSNYFGKDGSIFDTYTSSGIGIPDLVYHCRNLEILSSNIYWNGSLDNVDKVINGFDFVMKLLCDDGNLGYYGRSNDSVYGISSLLLSFSYGMQIFVDQSTIFKKFYKKIYENIYNNYLDHQRGSFNIYPSSKDTKMCYTDPYIHYSVYNYFAFSRILLSDYVVKNETKFFLKKKHYFQTALQKKYVFKNSGFIKINSKFETVFNFKGHYDSEMIKDDYRYPALSLIRLVYNGKNQIPLLSSSYNPYQNKYAKKNFLSRARSYLYAINRLLILPGFTPLILINEVFYKPNKGKIISQSNDGLTIEYDICPIENLKKKFYSFNNRIINNEKQKIILKQKIIIGNGITFNFSINKPCKVVYSITTDKNLELVKLDNQLILNRKIVFSFDKALFKNSSRYFLNSRGLVNCKLFKVGDELLNNFSLVIYDN